MKKIIICLCFLILIGCQSKEVTTSHQEISNEDLVLKEWKYLMFSGDANEQGYYFIKRQEDGLSHISYYDYASSKEVLLCNKPECQHSDETCTAYLSYEEALSQLFVYGNYLYRIEAMGQMINSLGESEDSASRIVRMDLDGQNKKEILRINAGEEFDYTDLVIGNGYLYIPIVKSKQYESSKSHSFQVTTEKILYAIHLETGEILKITDMKDKKIIGVEDRKIIFSTIHYKEDPQKYLDNKDFTKYEQAVTRYKLSYDVYDIDTKEINEIQTDQIEQGTYYQNKIYSIENSTLYALDLNTKKKEKVIEFKKDASYTISMFLQDYIIVEKWKDDFIASYKISLKDSKLEELKQYTRNPKQSVCILAKMANQLLVVYDRIGQEEKTWAGTMQFETTEEYIGVISIEDYLNNKDNYQEIKTLTKKRTE